MPPILVTATINGPYISPQAFVVGPVSGSVRVNYAVKAHGPSFTNRVSFGVSASVTVIPPQPYLLAGPIAVNPSTTWVRSHIGPFTRAGHPATKAILAVVSSTADPGGGSSNLSAFVTQDNGATWAEYPGPSIYQITPDVWQGVGFTIDSNGDAVIVGPWCPSDGLATAGLCAYSLPQTNPNGLNPGFETAFGIGDKPITAAREGNSDDIFTINSSISFGPRDVFQMPYGMQFEEDPYHKLMAYPFNQRSFPRSYHDWGYISQKCAGIVNLYLYSFNLGTLAWVNRGQCGEAPIQGPSGPYHDSGNGGGTQLDAWPEIIGISNGRGICLCHYGGTYYGPVGGTSWITELPSKVVPGSVYPPQVSGGLAPFGSEMVINFSTRGGSHSWSYVADPTADSSPTGPPSSIWRRGLPGGNNNSSFGTAKGVDPATGDIIYGASQVDINDVNMRFRMMTWPSGSTSEVPIFSDIPGTGFPLLPPQATPANSPFNSSPVTIPTFISPTMYCYRNRDLTMTQLTLIAEPQTGDFSVLGWPDTLLLNRLSQAYATIYAVLATLGANGVYIRVRLGWIPFGPSPPLRPAPAIYYDDIPPFSFYESSGSKAYPQNFPGATGPQTSYCQELFPDRTAGFLAIQQQLNPAYFDSCQSVSGSPSFYGGIHQIQYYNVWIPWPVSSGSYIVGKGRFGFA